LRNEAGASLDDARKRFHHRATSGFFHDGRMAVHFAAGHGGMVEGKEVEPLPPSLWPDTALMDKGSTFYPSLSLPTAEEDPGFWGPPYAD
jgi:hypothetical protein